MYLIWVSKLPTCTRPQSPLSQKLDSRLTPNVNAVKTFGHLSDELADPVRGTFFLGDFNQWNWGLGYSLRDVI